MKPLKALISKNTIHRAHVNTDWPNPYNLTKEDAKGKLKGVSLEIITLILKEMELQGKTDCLYKAQNLGITSNIVFNWDKSKDGSKFWSAIWYDKKYDVFYNRYTPDRLRERIKEKF